MCPGKVYKENMCASHHRTHRKRRLNGNDKVWHRSSVYVFTATDYDAMKVGKSNNPARRLANVRGSTPLELKLHSVAYFEAWDVFEIEQAVHKALADTHIRGEWFRKDPLAADQAILDAAYRLGLPYFNLDGHHLEIERLMDESRGDYEIDLKFCQEALRALEPELAVD